MSLTESKNLKMWMKAPVFVLPDTVSGKNLSLEDVAWEKATVIMFICNHCPFVVHINSTIVKLANEYKQKGVNFVWISANDVVTHPADWPEEMKEHAKEQWYSFPYLYDETQEIARSYSAVCTPDIFVFWENRELIYHWQLDDSRPGNNLECTWDDLTWALDLYLESCGIVENQKPSIGCNIKWK